MILLCRNKVEDYAHWRKVFDANLDGPQGAGLTLTRIWQDTDDPNQVFFIFEVQDKDQALAFMEDPASVSKGQEARVIEGEAYFLVEGVDP